MALASKPDTAWKSKPTPGHVFHYWRSGPQDRAYRLFEVRGREAYGTMPSMRAVSVLMMAGEWQPVPDPAP